MNDLHEAVRRAVRQFWTTRGRQASQQGRASGRKDQGARGAVTGGAQLDGFCTLLEELLIEAGLPRASVFRKRAVDLPGYFRAEKRWDLLVVVEGQLLAVIECKSHVGPSFGNNFNNRAEESLGSATDLWAAYREGAFAPSRRPWLGYLILLEESRGSTSPVKVAESHFKVRPEFRNASYLDRYRVLLLSLLRERLYDGACLLVSSRARGRRGDYSEPHPELTFPRMALELS